MAVEKHPRALMEPSSMDKIMEIDAHIGCGQRPTADAQSTEHGRVQAQNHYFTYNESSPAFPTQSLCSLSSNRDRRQGSMSRPFGVTLLVAGHDADEGYQLYHTDPSGTFVSYQAKAIGSGSEGAQATLQESTGRT